jgi:hypothetical protein
MTRKINVMGVENFKDIGIFFYCRSDDIYSQNGSELLKWFDGAEKITLDDKSEYGIVTISPVMPQFTKKAAFLIKVDTNDIPMGIYPTTATIH